jgi:D-serine deaminase-like pyridoxal phosphate-dependent protein
LLVLAAGPAGSAWAAERVCFRTPAEAAVEAGVADVQGFRLEATRRDVLAGTVWATVRSCAHPGEPARWVFAAGLSSLARHGSERPRTSIAEAVMHAGTRVTLLLHGANVQVEATAVALENGVVGDRVRVRIVGTSAEAGERIAEGVVRDAKVVEVDEETEVRR